LIARLVDGHGEPIFKRCRWQGPTVNLGLRHPRDLIQRQVLLKREDDGSLHEIPFEQAGIRTLRRDPGTGYHQPRGSLIWYQSDLPELGNRAEIDSTEIRPMLLKALEIA
jgi:hypothetical protein